MNEDIIKAFKIIAEEILGLFNEVLASDIGINQHNGKNTLKDSRLARTAITKAEPPLINLIVRDYIEYIESGRKRNSKRIPIDALAEWAKEKGISTKNEVLYAIQQSIFRDGISPRPIMDYFFDMLNKKFDNSYYDILFNSIITNLTKYFND